MTGDQLPIFKTVKHLDFPEAGGIQFLAFTADGAPWRLTYQRQKADREGSQFYMELVYFPLPVVVLGGGS